jgi:hypothetical protein
MVEEVTDRRALARQALAGYVNGPEAATEATVQALAKVDDLDAEAVILVEGISDQIAVETLAGRSGRDLDGERVVVVPIGGAQAITTFLRRFGSGGEDRRVVGLCDAGEEEVFLRGLRAAGLGTPETRAAMAVLGFHVCVDDLEDELIRAVGPGGVETLLDSQGDLGSFRTLQKQPAWKGRAVESQLRRFIGAGARRKLRYARLLVGSIDPERAPRPLAAVLADVDPRRR